MLPHRMHNQNLIFFLVFYSLPTNRTDIPDADSDSLLRHPATESEHGLFFYQARWGPREDASKRLRGDGTRIRHRRTCDEGWLQPPRPTSLRRPHSTTSWRQPQPRGHYSRPCSGHQSPLNWFCKQLSCMNRWIFGAMDEAMWNDLFCYF